MSNENKREVERGALTLAKTYDKCKSGQPRLTVVMIHGIASSSATYDKALDFLRKDADLKDVRFVTFDLLGAGKSMKSDALDYDLEEQTTALHNAIMGLGEIGPLVLVGHSMGTIIATNYANEYGVDKLILLSPPIYTRNDLENPMLEAALKMFRDAVSIKNREILEEKAFNNEMALIVLNPENYGRLLKVTIPTVLIYGRGDQFIASYNIPGVVRKNPNIKALATVGRHSVSLEKYSRLAEILKEML